MDGGRNTERGAGTFTMNMNIRRSFGLGGTRPQTGGGGAAPALLAAQGQGGRGGGGGGRGGFGNDASFNTRYSMELVLSANNILNRVNYGGFSGNMLSPFFMRPTSAQNPRELQLSMQFRF